jgi:hypothetical protein
MRKQKWLLVLLISANLACAREKTQGVTPAAEQTPYTLKVTFEGLIGYLNKPDNVWALLPRARQKNMPPGYDLNHLSHYPEHYAILKVNGANVKGFGIPIDLQIPIDDKEIQVSDDFGGRYGIPSNPFRQNPMKPEVDQLEPAVLTSNYPNLAARVKLPLMTAEADWIIEESENPNEAPHDFVDVYPKTKNDKNFCDDADIKPVTEPRVQAVTWQRKNLTGEVVLKLRTLDGKDLPPLELQANGQGTVQVWILNQDTSSLHNPTYRPLHWQAYRWFYNLSKTSYQSDCAKHYYPQGETGGNRCPQKLYSE